MITTEELRASLLSAGTKRTDDFNKLNATLAALKDVDESIEMVNAKKKLQEQELKNSTDNLISSLFQTVVLLTTKIDDLENKITSLEKSKCKCSKSENTEDEPGESDSMRENSTYTKNQEDDITKKEDIDVLEDYTKEAAESM